MIAPRRARFPWLLRPLRILPDRGMVTAEFAAAMPAFMLMLCVALGAVGAVATQLRCEHAAYLAAREAGRGDAEVPARASSRDTRVEIARRDGRVYATVRAKVEILGAKLPGISISATSAAALEQG